MIARLDRDLTDVLPVELVEVDGQEGRGDRLPEIAADDLLQVQLETVPIRFLEASVVGGEPDGRAGVVDTDEQRAAGRVQETGDRS